MKKRTKFISATALALSLGLSTFAAPISLGVQNVYAATAQTVDKTGLEAVIKQVEGLEGTEFTAASWNALSNMYLAANAVYENNNASEKAVQDYTAALQATVNALISVNNMDGLYQINGILLQYDHPDRASMADQAVSKPMKVRISGEDVKLYLTLSPIQQTGFTGYLGEMGYFADPTSSPESMAATPVDVISYYDGVYDQYNDPNSGTDAKLKGCLYPQEVMIPMAYGTDNILVEVYVPVMEAIMEGSGTKQSFINLDWSEGSFVQVQDASLDFSGLEAAIATAQTVLNDVEDETDRAALQSAIDFATSLLTTAGSQEQIQNQIDSLNTVAAAIQQPMDYRNLKDGEYTVHGDMIKTDKKNPSMSDKSIDHNIKLLVKDGVYYLIMDFNGMMINNMQGYLGTMQYFKTGYTLDEYGYPKGDTAEADVLQYQLDASGNKIVDQYGTDYPDIVQFPMISEALEEGYVPLKVFVPVMDSITPGLGDQEVFLKLDWSTLQKGFVESPEPNPNPEVDPDNNNPNGGGSLPGGNNKPNGGGGLPGGNTLPGGNKKPGGGLPGGGLPGGGLPGGGLPSGNKKPGGGLPGGKAGGTSLTSAAGAKTGDFAQDNSVWFAMISLGAATLGTGLFIYKKKSQNVEK